MHCPTRSTGKCLIISTTHDAESGPQPSGFLAQGSGQSGSRRIIGLSAALLAEALLLLLLFSIGYGISADNEDSEDLVTFSAQDFAEEPPQESPEEPTPPAETAVPQPPVPNPQPQPEPVDQLPEPVPPIVPSPVALPQPVPAPVAPAPPPRATAPPRNYGPPTDGNPGPRDSQRVGTASNGQPLYAARWYREPTDQELAGYLSTASGPGSAVIECRTVRDFRVEDCILLGETPLGSQIGRAVLASAWQFRVRPARIGGRSQVGSWVRIRIDYTRTPRPR